MPGYTPPQLVRLIVTPFVTIGVLAAVLVWDIEHVGSILLAVLIAVTGVAIGAFVSHQLRRDIETVADYYAALLRTADEQSRQTEAANRLKDEFLATLSHELRTPLNSVLGWARLLASGKLDALQTMHAVQAIERAGWAQSRVIEDLLDTSRIVSGRLELTMQPTSVKSLVEAAVELHGGTVTAMSAGEDKGSTFEVRLPIRAWDTAVAEPPRLDTLAPSLRGVTVLVVDDDADARDFVRATLEQYGAVVVTAASAGEAKAQFRREPPDVMVSDLMMPGEDGLQLIRDIRQLDRAAGRLTPAAAITTLARADDRRRALTAGYQMHTAKPVDPSELVSIVERLVQPQSAYGEH